MNCDSYHDLAAAHVDNALTPEELGEVQVHLQECEPCRRLFEEESRFHAAFSARSLVVPVPNDVEQRLRHALGAESRSWWSVWAHLYSLLPARPGFPRLAFGLTVTGVLIALVFPHLFRSASTPPLFDRAVHYYQAVTNGTLPVEYATDDPQRLQATLNVSGRLNFTTQVSDLRSAGYRLTGGSVTTDTEQPLAVAVYEQDQAEPIVCLRQRGTLPALPEGTRDGQGLYWYTAEGYTAMFTQFPDHFCVMISRQAEDALRVHVARPPGS